MALVSFKMNYVSLLAFLAVLISNPKNTSAFLGCVSKTSPVHNKKCLISPPEKIRHLRLLSSPAGVEESTMEEVSSTIDPAPSTLITDLVVGNDYQGVVTNVVNYGIFVDIGVEVNGLVHISQISNSFVRSTKDMAKVGDVVSVKVLSVEPENKKIELSMKHENRSFKKYQTDDMSPYEKILAEDPTQFIDGVVDHIIEHGAFVKLNLGGYGFLHVSEMRSDGARVENVSDIVSKSQELKVRVLAIDKLRSRVNISLLPYVERVVEDKPERDVSAIVDLNKDEFYTGTVASVHEYGVFVTLNGVDGLLHLSKMKGPKLSFDQMKQKFTVGDDIQVRVLDIDTENNKLSLTMLPVQREPNYEKFINLAPDEWIEGTVVSLTEYGAFVSLDDGPDGMVHISELGDVRLDNVSDAVNVGDVVKVRVIEVIPEKGKIRLSMRDPSIPKPARNRRGKKIKNVEKFVDFPSDKWIDGTVQTFTDFGAFIRIDDNTDGLLHVTQMDNDFHNQLPEDVLELNQQVKVRVIDVDVDNQRISLSMKDPNADSEKRSRQYGSRNYRDVTQFLDVGPEQYFKGKVMSIHPYGAFIEIENSGGCQGLLHISQISEERIDSPDEYVREGDEVNVRIVSVDVDAGKISLSMLEPSSRKNAPRVSEFDNDDDGSDFDYGEDGTTQYKKSPRPRFNDLNYLDEQEAPASEAKDWHKYLNNYLEDHDEPQE